MQKKIRKYAKTAFSRGSSLLNDWVIYSAQMEEEHEKNVIVRIGVVGFVKYNFKMLERFRRLFNIYYIILSLQTFLW